MKFASFIVLLVLAASPAAAQTVDTSTSQVCSQDPTYCSDTGAAQSTTTTGSGAGSSASSGGSGGRVGRLQLTSCRSCPITIGKESSARIHSGKKVGSTYNPFYRWRLRLR
jgi:hypothetical protein